VICGDLLKKDYIIETVGCGCAFIDYDNDGWMGLFVLSGTRMSETISPARRPNLASRSKIA
jgi:hypothetical protein